MNGWRVTLLEGGGWRVVADDHPLPDVGFPALTAGSRSPRVVKSHTVGAGLRPDSRGRGQPATPSHGRRAERDPSESPFVQPVRNAQRRTSTVAEAIAARQARWPG